MYHSKFGTFKKAKPTAFRRKENYIYTDIFQVNSVHWFYSASPPPSPAWMPAKSRFPTWVVQLKRQWPTVLHLASGGEKDDSGSAISGYRDFTRCIESSCSPHVPKLFGKCLMALDETTFFLEGTSILPNALRIFTYKSISSGLAS